MIQEDNGLVVGEEIHAEDMLQSPCALVKKQCRRPCVEFVNRSFDWPVVEMFVPESVDDVEAENQHEKQPDIEISLISFVCVKLFYSLFV